MQMIGTSSMCRAKGKKNKQGLLIEDDGADSCWALFTFWSILQLHDFRSDESRLIIIEKQTRIQINFLSINLNK